MKQTLISASIVAMLSSGAIAGNIDTATADPVIATPPASTSTDWSGSYCGLSYSSGGGTDAGSNGSTYDYFDDTAIGVFCGNNWQRSNLVYGGELNVTAGSLVLDDGWGRELGTRTELRARVGYAMGDALVYGFLGYGTSEITWVGGTPPFGYDVAGGTYGMGVDYMVTDSMFAGFEVSNLELTGTKGGGEHTHDINVISLRIGWKFN